MASDEFTTLRDALAQIRAPMIDVEDLATRLDAALLDAMRVEQMARSLANHLDAAMSQALAVHLAAGDAAAALALIASQIADLAAQCKAAHQHARKALSLALDKSGAPDTETETHKADPIKAGKKLVVENVSLLPHDCVEYVPTPINKKITARLIAGLPTPGARLVDGEPNIRVTAKKVKRGVAA